MGCSAVVALAGATADGQTHFGQNSHRPASQCQPLCRTAARTFPSGQKLRAQYLELAQARQVYAVLGSQPHGCWGYDHGINEHQVAVGCVALRPAERCPEPGLLGTDLVRLTLERSHSALQAVDLLTSLVDRYGQGAFPGCPGHDERDNGFLIADPAEAYAIETAGKHWVYQQVREIRAMSPVRVMRQDWDRISHGLAAYAISKGWWPDDGSKLDFAGALGENPAKHASALWRWGRTTLRLQEQNGLLDTASLRLLLSDPYEGTRVDVNLRGVPSQHGASPRLAKRLFEENITARCVASLSGNPARLPMAWCAFGSPCVGVYFPVFLDGDLPEAFAHGGAEPRDTSFWWRVWRLGEQLQRNPESLARAGENFAHLQGCFDREAQEFMAEGAALKQRGCRADVQRQATLFMQHTLEQFEETVADLLRPRPLVAAKS